MKNIFGVVISVMYSGKSNINSGCCNPSININDESLFLSGKMIKKYNKVRHKQEPCAGRKGDKVFHCQEQRRKKVGKSTSLAERGEKVRH